MSFNTNILKIAAIALLFACFCASCSSSANGATANCKYTHMDGPVGVPVMICKNICRTKINCPCWNGDENSNLVSAGANIWTSWTDREGVTYQFHVYKKPQGCGRC